MYISVRLNTAVLKQVVDRWHIIGYIVILGHLGHVRLVAVDLWSVLAVDILMSIKKFIEAWSLGLRGVVVEIKLGGVALWLRGHIYLC